MNYNDLKAAIRAVVFQNDDNLITGEALQGALLSMINSLGAGYQFIDVATPSTNPGTPDQNVMYFAATAGTYTNFGGIVVNESEFCALCWNGSWIKKTTGAATAQQVAALGHEVYSIKALSTSYAYCRGKVSVALPGTIISNGKWTGVSSGVDYHIMIAVHTGDTIVINSGTRETIYGYLASVTQPKNNVAADFISGESRRSIGANSSVTIVASQDFYLYVTIKYSGTDYSPNSIEINGYRILKSASMFLDGTYPKDYGIDSEEMQALLTTKKFFETEKVVGGFPVPEIGLGYIGGNGRLSNIEAGYEHYIIKIMPGATIYIKARPYSQADYVVLKKYTSNYPSSAFCDTIQGRQRISGGNDTTFVAPSDAYVLVLTKMYNNSADYGPAAVEVNGINALTGTKSVNVRLLDLEGSISHPFLKYIAAQNKFEVFTKSSSGYVSYIITLENDAQIVQKLWRVTGGYVYGADKSQVVTTLFSGENEWAAKFNGFGSFEGYTGGYHGGELLDGDGTCFVKFFADGNEVSDLSADFEIPCSEFSYIQYTTLNKVKDTEDTPIPGTPIFAHHLKSVTFKDGEMVCKNVIVFADDSTALGITYSGLVCIHKQTGASVIVPTGISQNCVGDNGTINATDKLDGEFIFYNAQKNVKAVVSSRFVRGIDVQSYLTGLAGYVWDRSLDSKYYRQITGVIQCSAANKLEFETKVKIDY